MVFPHLLFDVSSATFGIFSCVLLHSLMGFITFLHAFYGVRSCVLSHAIICFVRLILLSEGPLWSVESSVMGYRPMPYGLTTDGYGHKKRPPLDKQGGGIIIIFDGDISLV